jgi:hypothetical protein
MLNLTLYYLEYSNDLILHLILGDAKIGVKNDGIYSNSTFQEVCGYATVPDPNIPGSLLVNFPSSKLTLSGSR